MTGQPMADSSRPSRVRNVARTIGKYAGMTLAMIITSLVVSWIAFPQAKESIRESIDAVVDTTYRQPTRAISACLNRTYENVFGSECPIGFVEMTDGGCFPDPALMHSAPIPERGFHCPVLNGTVTSRYGPKSNPTGDATWFHEGIDFSGNPDRTNYAVADGVVVFAGDAGAVGNLVTIDHGVIDGHHLTTSYAHSNRLTVKRGQHVVAGEAVGDTGSTGKVTGPHLHFTMEQDGHMVDPEQILKLHKCL